MNVGPNVELGACSVLYCKPISDIYCLYICVLVTKKKKYTSKIKNVM